MFFIPPPLVEVMIDFLGADFRFLAGERLGRMIIKPYPKVRRQDYWPLLWPRPNFRLAVRDPRSRRPLVMNYGKNIPTNQLLIRFLGPDGKNFFCELKFLAFSVIILWASLVLPGDFFWNR